MSYKFRDLRWAFTTAPPLDALGGGRVASASRMRSIHAQADNFLGNDRGVVARVGLQGSAAFQIPSANPANATQVYPLRSVYRTVARVPAFTLLPGHYLRLSALVEPSGMTNKADDAGGYMADGAYGEIAAAVTWAGPSADTTTHKLILPVSTETYAGEATAAGASWANLRRVEIPIMFPDAVTTSIADSRLWSEGATAAVEIKFKGGVRAVDVVLQQVPLAYARNTGTDTTYSAALTTNGAGALVPTFPITLPVEERTATDPTYGASLLADIIHRQHTALGPVFAHWTAWDESAAVSATDIPSVTTSSTTFVDMLDTSIAGWASTNPGWSIHGSQSQQFKTSNSKREMRGQNACVPVRVWAYCSTDGASPSTLRFQSANYSVCEIEVSSATPGWVSGTGYLRCGAHPQDPSVLQVLGKTAMVADTLSLSGILVEYADL